MNILALGAHPDDIEYGCAGTLLRCVQKQHSVYFLVLTQGEFGGDPQVRRDEQAASANLLNLKEVFWGGYTDTMIPVDKGLIDKIEAVIRRVSPEAILIPYYDDTHQDHRALSKTAVSATRYIRNVLFYECPTTQNFNPSVFVDIGAMLDKKVEIMQTLQSQVNKTNIEDLNICEIAVANATFRGIQGRVKYAEGFVPLRFFVNFF